MDIIYSCCLVLIFTFILIGVNVLAPTLFPELNISGIKDYINTFCVILSFMSAGLGIYSIWQANLSGKQATEILNSIKSIEKEQKFTKDLLEVITNTFDNEKTSQTSTINKENDWNIDKNTK